MKKVNIALAVQDDGKIVAKVCDGKASWQQISGQWRAQGMPGSFVAGINIHLPDHYTIDEHFLGAMARSFETAVACQAEKQKETKFFTPAELFWRIPERTT